MDNDTDMANADSARVYAAAVDGTIWDPRADLDDDGDVDTDDRAVWNDKELLWPPSGQGPTVAQAFSDVDNPFLFQGRPHLALDTAANATAPVVFFNHHRERYVPWTAAWLTRDPLGYRPRSMSLYQYLNSRPLTIMDPRGLEGCSVPSGDSIDLDPPPAPRCPQNPQPNSQGCPPQRPGQSIYGPSFGQPELPKDGWCWDKNWSDYHVPPAASCYRGYGVNSGKQCCYDSTGCLITDNMPGAGSADAVGPMYDEDSSGVCKMGKWRSIGHFVGDVLPYELGRCADFLNRGINWGLVGPDEQRGVCLPD